MIQRDKPFNGETMVEQHDKDIQTLMEESNLNSSALQGVQIAVKKVTQSSVSATAANHTASTTGVINPSNSYVVAVPHGLSYTPLAFGFVTVGGVNFNLPYIQFNSADGTVDGAINLTAGFPFVTIQSDWKTTATIPSFTAYVFVASTPALQG